MRRLILPLILLAAAALACTLSRTDPEGPPRVVTATLSAHVQTIGAPPTALVEVPTGVPSPMVQPSATPHPATDTLVPSPAPTVSAGPAQPPTLIPPTRTPPGPTAAPALDDGSGRVVPGTGGDSAYSLAEGVDALPETLYYLSPDVQGTPQVWRLRIGLSTPDQLSFNPSGVAAFDVSAEGTLAYTTPAGAMVIGGVPFALPDTPDGVAPAVTGLAWSPGGEWLAYTLHTPLPDDMPRRAPIIDGVYLRSREGTEVFLQANDYSQGASARVYSGPIRWRPDGTELLIASTSAAGVRYSRIDITANTVTPVWDTVNGRVGTFPAAQWSVNNNAIIGSGGGAILRIDPVSLNAETLLPANPELWPEGAQQFADGTVSFVGIGPDETRRLYLMAPGERAPRAITEALVAGGAVDFLWDDLVQQTLIAVYDAPGATTGAARLRTADGVLHDLTAVTGPVGDPRWGPAFQLGDLARVQTTQGDTLNIREQPSTNGAVLFQMVAGSRVVIMGGPRGADGFRWWRVRTPDGISGWAAESVIDERGLPLRTLIPTD